MALTRDTMLAWRKKMARRGGGGAAQASSGGIMAPVMSIATGLLVFVVLEIFSRISSAKFSGGYAPTIAGTIEAAQPDLGVDSDWNKTYNTDLPTGAETWTTKQGVI